MATIERLTHSYINKKNTLYGFEEDITKEAFLPLRLSNIDIAMANALRRVFMTEVPTVAFADANIKILANISQYNREVLIDRVKLITLYCSHPDIDDLIFMVCDPNDPSKPLKNTTSEILDVYLHKFLYVQKSSDKTAVKTPLVVPYDSLLMTLNPDEEVHIVMKPSWGVGIHHPQWQSSITMYKFETQSDTVATGLPESLDEQLHYTGYERQRPKAILLTVEANGKLEANKVVLKGIDILRQKLETFKQHLLIHDRSEVVSVETDENIPNLVKIKIQNETHTLGNILETACLEELHQLIIKTISSTNSEQVLDLLRESLSCYRQPHPLTNAIEYSIRTPQSVQLIFPQGKYDEIDNPSIRLVLLAVERVQDTCSKLLSEATILL